MRNRLRNVLIAVFVVVSVGAVAVAVAVAAEPKYSHVKFAPASLPSLHPAKHHLRSTKEVSMCGPEGCFSQPLDYHVILRSGEGVQCSKRSNRSIEVRSRRHSEEQCEEIFGLTKDQNEQPLFYTNAEGTKSSNYDVSDNPDFSSLLQVGSSFFSLVQFEYPRPGVMYLTRLHQDEQGQLSPVSSEMVDWSHQGGLWIPCAGSLSPWNTHIGGEEYEPDAKYFSALYYPNDTMICGSSFGVCTSIECAEDTISSTMWNQCSELTNAYSFAKYLAGSNGPQYPEHVDGIEELREIINPYDYGYAFEVAVGEDGSYNANKWYAVGRRSNELAYILPDERTMYLSDDGTNVVFHMFIADEPKDFSSGTLYAAKFNQETDGSKGGTFGIEWIDLGRATSEEIEEAAKTLKFHDLFEIAKPEVHFSEGKARVRCPEQFDSVNQGTAGVECLKVKEGMDLVASRLESRRYSAMKGATTEFTKLEGLTYDPHRNQMYAAVSDIKNGMEDNMSAGSPEVKYDIGGDNDIRVKYNKCGCVYTLKLDQDNRVTKMAPLLCGDSESGLDDKNYCNINSVSNPDNVAFLDDLDTLLIAEDTRNHENNVLWSYNVDTGEKDRIFIAPLGAEVTSPYFYRLGNYSYIMAVAQHPYEHNHWLFDTSSSGKAGHVGYIGPIQL